jgi:hypothetical protein
VVIALADGQLVKGQGGQSGNIVYQQWTADYAFVMDQLLFQYTPNANVSQTLANYLDGNLDYVLQDTALPAELNHVRGEKLLEMPLLGASLTFMHNVVLPANNTIPLQLSRTTLASIYSGQVYAWDDVAIKTDNPSLAALLPSANITLACLSGQPRLNDLLALGLSTFSSSFASLYNASGFSFGTPCYMLPSARGVRTTELKSLVFFPSCRCAAACAGWTSTGLRLGPGSVQLLRGDLECADLHGQRRRRLGHKVHGGEALFRSAAH